MYEDDEIGPGIRSAVGSEIMGTNNVGSVDTYGTIETLRSITIDTSQDSYRSKKISTRGIYLRHALRCAFSTIFCLIFYQIFFYNYGLAFKYIGSNNEIIVLFIQTIT